MWFLYALISFFAWGAADLFYKKSNSRDEKYTHLKTSVLVGLVFGATAIVTLCAKDLNYNPRNLLIYLPVSTMYILSMTVGYFGLRYLTVSVSSPIQNASGAVSALLLMFVLRRLPDGPTLAAIALVTAGVVYLGVLERRKELSVETEETYKTSFLAIFIPVAYCFIDSLGSFLDGLYLDDLATTPLVDVTADTLEDVANVSYLLTYLMVALILLLYLVFVKNEPFSLLRQKDRCFAALFETFGQLAYVYAISGNAIVAAPVISSYCIASLIFARLFLKEKLSKNQYAAVALVIAGIVILGIREGLDA